MKRGALAASCGRGSVSRLVLSKQLCPFPTALPVKDGVERRRFHTDSLCCPISNRVLAFRSLSTPPLTGRTSDSLENFRKGGDILTIGSAKRFLFQTLQNAMNFRGNQSARARQRNDERPPVTQARFPRQQSARLQPVENARQRRTLVRERTMQIGDGRIPRFGEMTEDMRFRLGEIRHVAGDVESNTMSRAVNPEDQLKLHSTISYYTIMNDIEFAAAFEDCSLPPEQFHHRDHIRLAWIYFHRYGPAAGARIAESIRRYAAHLGKSDKYHETMTQAWMRLVQHAAASSPSFDGMLDRCPWLLDKTYLHRFYSQDLLNSEQAKVSFVSEDRSSLP